MNQILRLAVLLVVLAWSRLAFCDEIHDAAAAGDLEKIKALLKVHPELVNSKDTNGWTPLLEATASRHKDVVELLLDSNADVNAKASYDLSPLVCAVMGPGKGEKRAPEKRTNQIEMVKLFLAHGVEADSKNNALREAAIHDNAEVAKLLLADNANVDSTDNDGRTPLYWAAINNCKDMVALLLANKANPNSTDRFNGTPFSDSAQFGDKDVIRLLLSNGAALNATNSKVAPALNVAVEWNRKDIVELLLSNKANVNVRDQAGWTPLHKAAGLAVGDHKDAIEIMKLLLTNNADVNAKDNNGLTPLHWAAGNSKDMVELLLAHGADINAKDNDGWTPLHEAKYYSHADIADFLRQHGGHE